MNQLISESVRELNSLQESAKTIFTCEWRYLSGFNFISRGCYCFKMDSFFRLGFRGETKELKNGLEKLELAIDEVL